MTRLRLVETAPAPTAAPAGPQPPAPLPRGRHGLPADLVRSHQRQRLLEAAATAVAEQGYGRVTAARITELARVSSRTFYQHFEDLWACLLASYETEGARLCAEIQRACGAAPEADPHTRAGEGIGAALAFLAAEPPVARLLSAEPPPQVTALADARRDLAERLGAMLRGALEAGGATPLPGLERRLVGAAMALVASRSAAEDPRALCRLEPELRDLLLASLRPPDPPL